MAAPDRPSPHTPRPTVYTCRRVGIPCRCSHRVRPRGFGQNEAAELVIGNRSTRRAAPRRSRQRGRHRRYGRPGGHHPLPPSLHASEGHTHLPAKPLSASVHGTKRLVASMPRGAASAGRPPRPMVVPGAHMSCIQKRWWCSGSLRSVNRRLAVMDRRRKRRDTAASFRATDGIGRRNQRRHQYRRRTSDWSIERITMDLSLTRTPVAVQKMGPSAINLEPPTLLTSVG